MSRNSKRKPTTQKRHRSAYNRKISLRSAMHDLSEKNKWTILLPKLEYCTDNAAMIGYLANYKFENKIFADPSFTPLARYPISTP